MIIDSTDFPRLAQLLLHFAIVRVPTKLVYFQVLRGFWFCHDIVPVSIPPSDYTPFDCAKYILTVTGWYV
jgi:hypothetical protein